MHRCFTKTTINLIHCRIFFVLAAGLLIASRARPQSMRIISTRDGLPQSFVSAIVQDDSSFIWIGTRNGLVRFDGVEYRIFQHHSDDPQSLASNFIIWIRKDAHNRLWIEHESGVIDRMDPVTEKITHILQGNTSIASGMHFMRRGWLADADGRFWGLTQAHGIERYDPQRKIIEHYDRAHAGFTSDTVRGIVETRDKSLWVLSRDQISRYDSASDRFIHWPVGTAGDYGNFVGSDAIAIDLHERKNGELIWGDRHTLYIFNPVTHRIRTVEIPFTSYLGLRWIRTSPNGLEYFESYGNLWQYGDSGGLKQIGRDLVKSFGDNKSFLVDRSGLIWIGSNGDGIKQIDLGQPHFKSQAYRNDFITDMLKEEFGVGMQQLFDWQAADNFYSKPSYQLRSAYGSENHLYISLKHTVCRLDSATHQFVRLPLLPADTRAIGLAIAPSGSPVVAGTNGKILRLNEANVHWQPVIEKSLRDYFNDSLLLPQDLIVDKKYLWITTASNGLLRVDPSTGQIRQFRTGAEPGALPANELLGLRADPNDSDVLWIGSYEGLIRFQKSAGRFTSYSLGEGLPDNTIYSILTDREHYLWLSTNKGLCRFDPVSHQSLVFQTQQGLPGDEFNRFHHLQLPDGTLVFGGVAGWTSFDPLAIRHDDFEPAISLTGIRVNNRPVRAETEKSLLNAPINSLNKLVLPYDQNSISIRFAGLEYSQPRELKYRYRLEGYDNDWVMAGSARTATYTKIPPGSYRLLVNASNTSGVWSRYIKSLDIRIGRPWWATTLAYICYSIILAGLIWTFIRFRISRILMKQEMLLKEKETAQWKELDDMKSRFFSNITHEFRTPLTLIMAPAEEIKASNSANAVQGKLADIITQNAQQLLSLVNRLMDLSKLEARAFRLVKQKGSPADLIGSVVHSFEMDARQRQIQLRFDDETNNLEGWFYADALERIVYNLVSNALKFTGTGGRVQVALSPDGEKLRLTVRDTGIGIAEDKLEHIFERFYQVHDEKPENGKRDIGTGIGLAMVRELATQMGAKIEVESRTGPGSGSLFTVVFSCRESDQPVLATTGPVQQTVEEAAENGGTAGKSKSILVVEDNRELAAYIARILGAQYEVRHAINGAKGLEEALAFMPDLIISDVMMPVMDGYVFCTRIREDIRTSHIPVILLTAKASQDDRISGLSQGANDYLTKPFHPTELLLRVQNLFSTQDKLREKMLQDLSTLPGELPIGSPPPVQDIFLTRLYELLDEHLDDSLFGVDQLVDLMAMSRSSLHRKLKSLTGLSTTEVVRNYRLKKATGFLREGYNSSDTAYKSGFGSPAYFTKCFREVYGITPTEFIQKTKTV